MDSKVKTKIKQLIEKGWDTDRIMKKYPDITRQQIAGIKAHITRGSYS